MKNIKYLYFSFLKLFNPGVIPLQHSLVTLSPISIFNIPICFIQFILFGLFPGMSALGVYVVHDESLKHTPAFNLQVGKQMKISKLF